MVLDGAGESLGQASETPSQTSAASQIPTDGRHGVFCVAGMHVPTDPA
jgi:hypothetical protein